MKEVLASPYVRIALGAAISTWLTPKIVAKCAPAVDPAIHAQTSIGTSAAVTTVVFVILGMVGGKTAAAAATT